MKCKKETYALDGDFGLDEGRLCEGFSKFKIGMMGHCRDKKN
jgi:hypothetical protein